MSDPSPTSPPRRPRLSLQIKAISSDPSSRSSRVLAAAVDVRDRTTFNTLSNFYAAAIERSTPTREKPPAAVPSALIRPPLRLQTQDAVRTNTNKLPSHYVGPYLDTPLSAQPPSPAVAMEIRFPSTMTATPPLSASAVDPGTAYFACDGRPTEAKATTAVPGTPSTSKRPRRAAMLPSSLLRAPYSHPRALHSILRNSPLPPASPKPPASPISPRRQSLRLAEKAARRVAYNSPLCQTITTSRYTRSHMDLLAGGDDSPYTPDDGSSVDGASSSESVLDAAVTAAATRDGGDTPGPFEEMRRRVVTATSGTADASTPLSPTVGGGIRKRGGGRRREKKRRWVWTIGEDAADAEAHVENAALSAPTSSPRPRTRLQASREASGASTSLAGNGAAPVIAPSHAIAVPVIAIPAPRPRSRRQTALLTPVPAAPSPATVIATAAEDTPMRDTHDTEIPISAVFPVCAATEGAAAAEEEAATLPTLPDPPTPSGDSLMSQDSLFERVADIEMSDVSSFASETEHQPKVWGAAAGEDDVDTVTPTALAPPVLEMLEDACSDAM
ncbi:hypothetical protein P8C59_000263 [Phyllachora maydis]|uniref:Uncharacterized protein n=1 Tax=Phyllachora maydis TaxID=1825666 RepID=A0AAD9HX04_9PEZI|nr:hypothetical protein P8C59_000263 [Phyllachora maydis]